jgi:DNA modification methylase
MANKKITKWDPDDFELEMTTVWSFPDRGNWATHDSKWRGNWSPYIPRNILLRYSNEGDLVLDQFAGGGTTLIEAKLLNRNIIGVDINDVAINRCQEKVDFEREGANGKVYIHKGDARNLNFVTDESIDLICTHPPYANIIEYSEDIEGDLSHCKVPQFLEEMKSIASESYRVLKKGKFCAILMGDTRQKGHVIPMSFEVMKIFEAHGFKLKEIIIKEQHNCKTTGFWKTNSVKYNFLLLAHEYLFVFRKDM